jgi:hypothetical protein
MTLGGIISGTEPHPKLSSKGLKIVLCAPWYDVESDGERLTLPYWQVRRYYKAIRRAIKARQKAERKKAKLRSTTERKAEEILRRTQQTARVQAYLKELDSETRNG